MNKPLTIDQVRDILESNPIVLGEGENSVSVTGGNKGRELIEKLGLGEYMDDGRTFLQSLYETGWITLETIGELYVLDFSFMDYWKDDNEETKS